MAKRRPLFSIVVPCYNDGSYSDGNYLGRVLNSILSQGLKKYETEVILSDDCSPVSFKNIVDKYKNRLNITVVKTDHNCCPGNTRQKGVEAVTGKWLCFIDHDDMFCEGALNAVKQAIESTKEQYLIYTHFDKVDPDKNMNVIEEFRWTKTDPFLHGKFYNVDNFWKPCSIHFVKDLETHEDIALSKSVECGLTHLGRRPIYLNYVTYNWIYNKNSISHSKYFFNGEGIEQQRDFLQSHFGNSVRSQIDPVLSAYQNQVLNKGEALALIIPSLLGAWQSLASFKSDKIGQYLQLNDAYCSRSWHEVKEIIECNLTVVKVLLFKTFRDLVARVEERVKQNGVPETFLQWLTEIDTMNYSQIIEDATNLNTESEPVDANRPFFSCIIACYNDGRYKEGVYLDRLLDSLTRQGIERNELEIILSDDCSPTPFFDEMYAKYKDKLILKYIKTDYNFAPGNTRAKGVTIATGQWLCFADHDDIYYDDALKQAKKSITDKDERHFAFGDFNGVNPEGEITRKYECTLNWCHAKFYNKDNFWDKYGIHFVHDLKSHEDIAICTQVACALSAHISSYTYIHVPLYAWTDNPQSVSHAKYTVETETGPREFLEVFYADYIQSTGYMYLEQFKDHRIKITYAIKGVLEIMCYAYFYQQGFMFRRPDDYYKKNLEIAGEFVNTCKKTFNLNNDKIYAVVASEHAEMYYKVADQAKMATGKYIPTQTFRQWLNVVSPD